MDVAWSHKLFAYSRRNNDNAALYNGACKASRIDTNTHAQFLEGRYAHAHIVQFVHCVPGVPLNMIQSSCQSTNTSLIAIINTAYNYVYILNIPFKRSTKKGSNE